MYGKCREIYHTWILWALKRCFSCGCVETFWKNCLKAIALYNGARIIFGRAFAFRLVWCLVVSRLTRVCQVGHHPRSSPWLRKVVAVEWKMRTWSHNESMGPRWHWELTPLVVIENQKVIEPQNYSMVWAGSSHASSWGLGGSFQDSSFHEWMIFAHL